MTFGAILMLAVGLAMDATAVSATRGMAVPTIRIRHIAIVSLFFGGFQALMPLIGWIIGTSVGPLVQTWDHWIAFVLLAAVGGKMVWEAREGAERTPVDCESNVFGLRIMTVLAVATSIDALAVGITLPMLDAPLVLSLLTIGATTGLLSALGLFAGRRFGAALGQKLDVAGGLLLVGLGLKILVEHLTSA
ncbi:MAG TPA: manganese efflux pump MntP family protein [Polyangiaceae bacterium]|nr:manganese efflux pump MntP family protein [Polyangiaceae bacterium]